MAAEETGDDKKGKGKKKNGGGKGGNTGPSASGKDSKNAKGIIFEVPSTSSKQNRLQNDEGKRKSKGGQ